MRIKGQRQSTNVDDITKQKKRVRTDKFAFPASEGGFIGDIKLKSTESKKKSNMAKVNSHTLREKSGMNAMNDANDRDKIMITENALKKSEMDERLNKAFSKENTSKAPAGYEKLAEATAPKQLTEIWTPRPLKKK